MTKDVSLVLFPGICLELWANMPGEFSEFRNQSLDRRKHSLSLLAWKIPRKEVQYTAFLTKYVNVLIDRVTGD